MILFKKAIEDFHARGRADSPTLRLTIDVETMVEVDISPAISSHYAFIYFNMQFSDPSHISVRMASNCRIIYHIVKIRQS